MSFNQKDDSLESESHVSEGCDEQGEGSLHRQSPRDDAIGEPVSLKTSTTSMRRAITDAGLGGNRISFSKLTSGLTKQPPLPREEVQSHHQEVDAATPDPTQPQDIGSVSAPPSNAMLSMLSFGRVQPTLDGNILELNTLNRSQGRGSSRTTIAQSLSNTKKFARKLLTARGNAKESPTETLAKEAPEPDKKRATYRRYRVGDTVLVTNSQVKGANLVNRYGYPAGGGLTSEETRGPYTYVLATVKKVHFDEDAEYYTVTRADTGVHQRADTGKRAFVMAFLCTLVKDIDTNSIRILELMEPLKTAHAEAAALRAATEEPQITSERGTHSARGKNSGSSSSLRGASQFSENIKIFISIIGSPFFWLYDYLAKLLGRRISRHANLALLATKRQGQLFLNGMKPYSCSMRLTIVNFLVICSVWYMFIDQARLAFIPRSADFALAIVSLYVQSLNDLRRYKSQGWY